MADVTEGDKDCSYSDAATHTNVECVFTVVSASSAMVEEVINANPDLEDGVTRSQWLWFRFPNGDLVLGCFPQDDLYFTVEEDFRLQVANG